MKFLTMWGDMEGVRRLRIFIIAIIESVFTDIIHPDYISNPHRDEKVTGLNHGPLFFFFFCSC